MHQHLNSLRGREFSPLSEGVRRGAARPESAVQPKTLAQYKTDASHVVMERIYTTDMEALIHSQETRKQFYGNWLPAGTWVEGRRLYGPADKIEIEVQVALD